jgi:hypothetical protein
VADVSYDDLPPVSQQPLVPATGAALTDHTYDDLPPVSEAAAAKLKAEQKPPGTWGDLLHDTESGVLRGFAGLGGMIPDVIPATAAVGTSLYDAARHYIGGTDWADLPRPNNPHPVTDALTGLMDKSPVTSTQLNRPDLATNRYAATAGSLVPGAATAGGLAGALKTGAVMAPGAAAGQALAESGHPIAGTLAQTLLSVPGAKAGGAPTARGAVVQRGQELGLRFPAATVNPSSGNRLLATVAGKQNIQQHAQLNNAPVQNSVARTEIGLEPAPDAITPQDLQEASAKAAPGYNALRGAGNIDKAPDFNERISALQQANQGAARVVPGLKDEALDKLLEGMKRRGGSFDASDGVDAMSALRNQATLAGKSGDKATAAAYRGASKVIEDSIDSHLAAQGGASADILADYRASRTAFAKIGQVEDSLNSAGNVDPRVLAKALQNKAPLTDGLRTLAESAALDPNAFKPPAQSPGANRASLYAGLAAAGGGAAMAHTYLPGHTGLVATGVPIALAAGRKAAQVASLSKLTGLGVERQKQLDLARVLSAYGAQQPNAQSSPSQ